MKLYLTSLSLFIISLAMGQNKDSLITVSGYIDTYYIYDLNKPADNNRPGFIYSYNRNNEINLNLGFIKVAYATDKVHANLALMTGTYANANMAAEPGLLKNIYEANIGIKVSTKKNLWVDAGIFSSHIGFESAISKDCWNMTRSIMADNTPYYEAGAKISYTSDNNKWLLSGLILNGWQRIQRVDGNSLPSFGTQITFKPNSRITINSSTFIGTDKPDSARQMRYFHNFYGIFQLTDKLGVTAAFDYGVEEKSPQTSATNSWYSPAMIVRYSITDKLALALRGEYYDDRHGIIISTKTPRGFRTSGISLNVDYALFTNVLWRAEVRNFNSLDDVFIKEKKATDTNTFIGTSLAISF